MYAEVIFEPGSHSVVNYEDDAELREFLREHHRRALSGEAGGPTGHPAERITKVIQYGDMHPAEFEPGVDANNMARLIDGMKSSTTGALDGNQLVSAVRDEMSPVYPVSQGRHESIYKMDGKEMSLDFLAGDNDAA